MATIALSCTINYRTDLNIELIPVPSNQIAVNFDLSVNTVSGEGSINTIPASVVPKPVNTIDVLGELTRQYINGESTAEIVGPVINVPNLSNSISVDFDLQKNRASGETTIETGGAQLIPKPQNSIEVSTEIVGIKIEVIMNAVSRAHHNPLPFGLSGSAESGGLVDAKMNYVTRLSCSPDVGGSIENMYINHNIALTGSATVSVEGQMVTSYTTKLEGHALSSGVILGENSSRLILEGSATAGGSINFVRGLVTSLTGSADSRFIGTVYWDHVYKTPIELEIWLERIREYPIRLLVALEREEQFPIDVDVPIVRRFPIRVVYSKAKTLGNFHYPYNPPKNGFTGVRGAKLYTSADTKSGKVTFSTAPILSESRVIEQWEYMHDYFFESLQEMYEANNGTELYWYRIQDRGYRYLVEIVSLTGRPYKDKYYANVELELKPHEKEPL